MNIVRTDKSISIRINYSLGMAIGLHNGYDDSGYSLPGVG